MSTEASSPGSLHPLVRHIGSQSPIQLPPKHQLSTAPTQASGRARLVRNQRIPISSLLLSFKAHSPQTPNGKPKRTSNSKCRTPELRHRHRRLTLAARMMFKFHGPVKTEGAVAVACSDLLGGSFLISWCETALFTTVNINAVEVGFEEGS